MQIKDYVLWELCGHSNGYLKNFPKQKYVVLSNASKFDSCLYLAYLIFLFLHGGQHIWLPAQRPNR